MWEFIKEQMAENAFFKGGFLIAVFSGLLVYLRNVPRYLWMLLNKALFVSVQFDSRNILFHQFNTWMDDNGLVKNKRHVRVTVDDTSDPPVVRITADRRWYWFFRRGMFMEVTRLKDDSIGREAKVMKLGAADDGSLNLSTFIEEYQVRVFFWRRLKLFALLDEIASSYAISPPGYLTIYSYRSWREDWHPKKVQPKCTLDRVILRKGVKDLIINDMQMFIDSEDWYKQRQLPYQRGYMFCGPPGTGKTSLITVLASHFDLKICPMDLHDLTTDREIYNAFAAAPAHALIVIEDIDAVFRGRVNDRKDSRVTFSGLLNAINGVLVNTGRILIMTTNHAEKLDPALCRPGRVDKIINFEYADASQATKLFELFYPEAVHKARGFGEDCSKVELSPAEIISYFQMCNYTSWEPTDVKRLVHECKRTREEDRVLKELAKKEVERKEAEEDGPPVPQSAAETTSS